LNWFVKRCLHLLFPSICLVCRKDLLNSTASSVCSACLSKIKWLSFQQKGVPSLDTVYSAVEFKDQLRDLHHAFKYRGKDYLVTLLVDLWTRHWGVPKEIDCIVPIPMPFWRETRRGYNQSSLLAKELSKRWIKPLQTGWLIRKGGTPSQTGLSRRDRLKNAQNSFTLRKPHQKVAIHRVLLVDDVLTTGATLTTCARLLHECGVKEVHGSTLAYDPLKT